MKKSILGLFFIFSVLIAFWFVSAIFISSDLTSPENATYSSSATPNFVFDFTSDYNATFNCTLYVDDTNNGTNSSVLNTSTTIMGNISIDGLYPWYVNCTDSNGTNQSEIRYIIIDNSTSPTAVQGTLIDNYNSTSSSVTFDMRCYDNVNVSRIELWTNTTGTWHANYSNPSYTNNTWLNITIAGIPDGQNYKWAVWCNDTAELTNMTENRTVSVSAAPSLTLDYPAAYANMSATNISFNCSATDNFNLSNITLSVWFSNGTLFLINNTNVSGTSNYTNFSATMITNKSYNWTCSVCDNSSNCVTATNRSIVIDTTNPVVELSSPEQDDIVTTLKPTFEYEVSDKDTFKIKNCSLYLDDVWKLGDTSIDNGENSITITTSLSDGETYAWYVECFDYAGNKDASEEWNVIIDTGDDGGGGGGGSSSEEVNIITAASNAKLAGNVSQGDKTMTGLVKGDMVNFTLGKDAHSLIIMSVNSTSSVTIEIRSTVITAVINAGETKYFDLDGNGMNDFAITVQGISALKKINLILKRFEGTSVNATENLTTIGLLNNTHAQIGFGFLKDIKWDSIGNFFKKYWIYIAIFLVVAAAVVLGIIFRKKIFKSSGYWWRKGSKVRLK